MHNSCWNELRMEKLTWGKFTPLTDLRQVKYQYLSKKSISPLCAGFIELFVGRCWSVFMGTERAFGPCKPVNVAFNGICVNIYIYCMHSRVKHINGTDIVHVVQIILAACLQSARGGLYIIGQRDIRSERKRGRLS